MPWVRDKTYRQLDHATPSVAIGRMWCMKDKCVDPRAGTTGKLTAAAAAAAVKRIQWTFG